MYTLERGYQDKLLLKDSFCWLSDQCAPFVCKPTLNYVRQVQDIQHLVQFGFQMVNITVLTDNDNKYP